MNPLSVLIDLILPRVCHVCEKKLVDGEEFICRDCVARLPLTRYERYRFNRSAPNSDLNPMEQRFAGQLPLVHAGAPFFYTRDSALASLIHDFKYRGFSRLASAMGHLGARTLMESGLFQGVDIMIPVPLHWSKRLRRGYNQSLFIAEGVSEATGIPVGTHLRAVRPHRTQTSLSREQRAANPRGIFRVARPYELAGKHVMIIDDICTTGATLLSAGEALAAATDHNIRLSFFTLGVV